MEQPQSDTTKPTIGCVFGIFFAVLVAFLLLSQCHKTKDSQTVETTSVTSSSKSVAPNDQTTTSQDIDIPSTNDTYTEETSNATVDPQYTVVYYKTGDRPYQSYYGKGQYDSETHNSLLIKNGSSTDAVVFLETLGGKKVRHVYVCKGDNFKMTQIPGGLYVTKIIQGNSWNPAKSNGEYAPNGGFMEDVSMSKSEYDDPFDFPYPSSGQYIEYEITLYEVTNGNFHTEHINAEEMF